MAMLPALPSWIIAVVQRPHQHGKSRHDDHAL